MGADSERFVVRVSLLAREQFREKKALAEQSPNSTHAKTWRVISELPSRNSDPASTSVP
jgi:hypothetical protein